RPCPRAGWRLKPYGVRSKNLMIDGTVSKGIRTRRPRRREVPLPPLLSYRRAITAGSVADEVADESASSATGRNRRSHAFEDQLAEVAPIADDCLTCRVCGGPLDPALATEGTHPICEES